RAVEKTRGFAQHREKARQRDVVLIGCEQKIAGSPGQGSLHLVARPNKGQGTRTVTFSCPPPLPLRRSPHMAVEAGLTLLVETAGTWRPYRYREGPLCRFCPLWRAMRGPVPRLSLPY